MNNEKYVSVEYDTWENFYKPLEENYRELEKKLHEEQNKRRMDIHVHFKSKLMRPMDDMQVGFVEMAIEGPAFIDIPSREGLANMLIRDIHNALKEHNGNHAYVNELQDSGYSGMPPRVKPTVLLTSDEIEEGCNRIDKKQEELNEKIKEFKKEKLKIEEVRKTLPNWVRLFYNIK